MRHTFGRYTVEVGEVLRIEPSKREKSKIRFLLIFSPLAFVALAIWLSVLPYKKVSLTIVVCGCLLTALFSFYFFFSLFKSYRNLRGVIIETKDNVIYVNKRKLCEKLDLKEIIIQPKADFSEVYGKTTSIGIKVRAREIPVSFDHEEREANEIALTLSKYLDCEIVKKKIIGISFFPKW